MLKTLHFCLLTLLFLQIKADNSNSHRCFDNCQLGTGPVLKTESRFWLTNFQCIIKCATEITRESILQGFLHRGSEKCFWLESLDSCVQRWKNNLNADCSEPIKELIEQDIQQSIVSISQSGILTFFVHIYFFRNPQCLCPNVSMIICKVIIHQNISIYSLK